MARKFIDNNALLYIFTKIKENFVAKEAGKGLSTNDFTNDLKTKLDGIAAGAQVNVQSDWNATEGDALILNKPYIPGKTSDLTNDSGFITSADIPEGAAASTTVPLMDGTATVGTEMAFARGDHIHPTDTSRAAAADLEAEVERAQAAEQANATAAENAQKAAEDAQADVDALEEKVGVVAEGKTVVKMIEDAQAAATYDDTAVKADIKANADAIDAIEADYLKAADKTALQGGIDGNAAEIATIKGDYLKAADKTELNGKITANTEAIDAIEADYLKAADKTELQGNINKKADQTALEAEIARAKAAEEANAANIALILDNPDTDVLDSIKEFTQYIEDHGDVATGLQTQITQNKTDLTALTGRVTTAEGEIDTLQTDVDAVEERLAAIEADYLKSTDMVVLTNEEIDTIFNNA